MKLHNTKPLWQAIGLGIIAGMRSMSAPAVTSHILSNHPSTPLKNSPLSFMQSGTTAKIMKFVAASEVVGDKIPGAPDRIKPQVLIGRCISGALVGGSIYKAGGKDIATGALIGCAAAIASSFGFFYLRKATADNTKIVDPILGVIEDALVLGASVALAKTN